MLTFASDYDNIRRKDLDLMNQKRDQEPGKETYRLNLVKCVYWTCLQLETYVLNPLSVLWTLTRR
jgi:hypothetical protein